jgi:hypothetical protein
MTAASRAKREHTPTDKPQRAPLPSGMMALPMSTDEKADVEFARELISVRVR